MRSANVTDVFLADRTDGHAFGTRFCLLPVCNARIVAKRYVVEGRR